MRLFKILGHLGQACHGGSGYWHLPTQREDGTWKPGEWMPPIRGKLRPCANGYHLTTLSHLFQWMGHRVAFEYQERLWQMERLAEYLELEVEPDELGHLRSLAQG